MYLSWLHFECIVGEIIKNAKPLFDLKNKKSVMESFQSKKDELEKEMENMTATQQSRIKSFREEAKKASAAINALSDCKTVNVG
jgi:hypothetical protein